MRAGPRLAAAAVALVLGVGGCGRGWGVSIDVAPGCLADPASLEIEVQLRPGGARQSITIQNAASFFSGAHRVVVVPPDGTTDVFVTISARGRGGTTAVGQVGVMVHGHQLVEGSLELDRCFAPDGASLGDASAAADSAAPDGATQDSAGAGDGLRLEIGTPCTDTSCTGATLLCDHSTGACVACLADSDCVPGAVCRGKACVAGCSGMHSCGDGGVCDPNAGRCVSCGKDADCMAPTPRCDLAIGRCVACAIGGADCPVGQTCHALNGVPGCAKVCQVDGDCPRAGCCGGLCTDEQVDAQNCGGCGKECRFANGYGGCAGGQCEVAGCAPGFGDCDHLPGNGCESPLGADANNCLSCGRRCTVPNGVPACLVGCTVGGCAMGFADCDKVYQNGCESQVVTDAKNCGACGMACPVPPHASAGCSNGRCGVGVCLGGFLDCDGNPQNGCEVDGFNDPASCRTCGNKCPALPHATPGCQLGNCGVGACDANWGDCDKAPQNGCELDLSADAANCGACGAACKPAHASASCAAGLCTITKCDLGFADCDKKAADGCEIVTASDLNNCGGCGNVCPMRMNANVQCTNSACVSSCILPFAECDNDPNTPCETNTSTDVKNCGGCNKPCMPGEFCMVGTCLPLPKGDMIFSLDMLGGLIDGGIPMPDGTPADLLSPPPQVDLAQQTACMDGFMPPPLCVKGFDPETNAPYVICLADCSHMLLSADGIGGTYHAQQICLAFGYKTFMSWGKTCGNTCGSCQGMGTCMNAFPPQGGVGNCGIDGNNGPTLCGQVGWFCTR